MKTLTPATLLALLLAGTALSAQTNAAQAPGTQSGSGDTAALTITLTHPDQPARLKLSALRGSVVVRAYSGKQIVINGLPPQNRTRPVPAEAAGMRRLTNSGVNYEEDNNVVTLKPLLNGAGNGDYDIEVPANTSLSLDSTMGSIHVEGVTGEIDVSTMNGSITLHRVGGSVVAHTLNGSLTADLTRLDSDKPSSFTTMNGEVNVTLPGNLHANLAMRSDRGDVYIDRGFDFKPGAPQTADAAAAATAPDSHDESALAAALAAQVQAARATDMMKLKLDNAIRGQINGGGVELNFRSYNGNILVHKG